MAASGTYLNMNKILTVDHFEVPVNTSWSVKEVKFYGTETNISLLLLKVNYLHNLTQLYSTGNFS